MSDERSETSPKGADDLIRDALPEDKGLLEPEQVLAWAEVGCQVHHEDHLREAIRHLGDHAQARDEQNSRLEAALRLAMEQTSEWMYEVPWLVDTSDGEHLDGEFEKRQNANHAAIAAVLRGEGT